MSNISPKEAVGRIFSIEDSAAIDRAIARLDECGYKIVAKDRARPTPATLIVSTPAERAAADYRRQLALT